MRRPSSVFLSSIAAAFVALAGARPARAIEGAPYLLGNEGVQAAALAGAAGAEAGTPEAMWYNPAALTDLSGVEASFARLSHAGAMDSDHILLAGPLGWKNHLGLLYHRNSAQDSLRDAQGNESGTFEVSQSVLGFSFSRRWRDYSVGLSYKMLSEVLEKQSGSSGVFDFGVLAEFSRDALVLGASLQNVGQAPQLGTGGPQVDAPMLARASAALSFRDDISRWRMLLDYHYAMVSGRSGFSLGLDYSEEYEDSRLGLRAGWDFSQGALGGVAGLAVGAGFGIGPVGFDYAFAPKEALGMQHRVALTLLWDLRAKSKEADLNATLGSRLASVATPLPTPTPIKAAPLRSDSSGAAFDALLAATPSPTPVLSPTPVVEEKKKQAGGILGAISRLFSFGGKPTEADPDAPKRSGLLQGVFQFLGFSKPADEIPSEPVPVEDRGSSSEERNAEPTPEATPTALPMQRLKGDSVALPPTPVPTPMKDKVKGWMKF